MGTYTGSNLFLFLSSATGVPVDQVNFMLCQLLALGCAFLYRRHCSPRNSSYVLRHAIALVVGVSIGIFCFGRQMVHMFAQAGGCYVLMKWAPSYAMHMCVFAFAMLYLSFMHIQRIFYDYGGYTLDVSLPMMLASQKLTSLAFSLHDGLYKKQGSLKFDQKKYAVSQLPNPLVFFSYMFYFQSIMVGPLCFFNDYVSFIEGKNFPIERPIILSKKDDNDKQQKEELNPLSAVLRKVGAAFAAMLCSLLIAPIWPKIRNVDKEFIAKTSFLFRIGFLLWSVALARTRYYFAWKLGDAINNASGLGFNGYDSKGKQRWDLMNNVNIRGVEGATSFKSIVDNWNIQTAVWLKRTCYERAPFSKTILTYVLSAVWHGFYPGYYFSFVSASFCTMAARSVRRNIRPHFQVNIWTQGLYAFITWFAAQLTLAYLVVPFTALEMWPTLYFYHYSMFWFHHVLTFLILIFLPYKSTSPRPQKAAIAPDNSTGTNLQDTANNTQTQSSSPEALDMTHTHELEEMSEQLNQGVEDSLGFGLPHTPVHSKTEAPLQSTLLQRNVAKKIMAENENATFSDDFKSAGLAEEERGLDEEQKLKSQ